MMWLVIGKIGDTAQNTSDSCCILCKSFIKPGLIETTTKSVCMSKFFCTLTHILLANPGQKTKINCFMLSLYVTCFQLVKGWILIGSNHRWTVVSLNESPFLTQWMTDSELTEQFCFFALPSSLFTFLFPLPWCVSYVTCSVVALPFVAFSHRDCTQRKNCAFHRTRKHSRAGTGVQQVACN